MIKIISKICRWFRVNKIILMLILLTGIILGSPLLIFGPSKSFFYSIDPDIVYVTNALLYTKANVIVYMDHPGTPTIVLLHYLYIPLRLIAKYILHENFIQWSFNNYVFLTYFLRFFQLILSCLGLLIFLSIIKKYFKSNWLVLIAFILVFSFVGLSKSLSIAPENLSFFLTACWFIFLAKFIETKRYLWTIGMTTISGFVFANKFTSLFLIIISLFIIFYIKGNIGKKLLLVITNFSFALGTFFIGIWPIRIRLANIINWGQSLFLHAGKYGYGAKTIFDFETYSTSLLFLIKTQPLTFIFILFTVLFGIYLLIKRKLTIKNPVILVFLVSLAGILIFSKYPTIHYNFVNIFVMVSCAVYFISKFRTKSIKFITFTLIIVFIFSSFSYIKESVLLLTKPQSSSVSDLLQAWTPFWSADIFKDQLEAVKF
jgi:hypothetical protein